MPDMGPKKWGIAAKREATEKKLAEINPLTCSNRLAIIFDDSGSMSGQPLEDAKSAVRNFTASCNQFDTSLAILPLNGSKQPLTINYDLLNLFVLSINVSGSTPLYTKMIEGMKEEVTRLVVFSDGDPTDDSGYSYSSMSEEDLAVKTQKTWKESWLEYYKTLKTRFERDIPHDTIFIGKATDKGYTEMKWIAEQTGGIFIHFQDSKSLAGGLKYLAPALRGFLANAELKAKIEKGEQI